MLYYTLYIYTENFCVIVNHIYKEIRCIVVLNKKMSFFFLLQNWRTGGTVWGLVSGWWGRSRERVQEVEYVANNVYTCVYVHMCSLVAKSANLVAFLMYDFDLVDWYLSIHREEMTEKLAMFYLFYFMLELQLHTMPIFNNPKLRGN
jgi:hypothetical protein